MRKIGKLTAAIAVVVSLCVQIASAVSYRYDKIGRVVSATYKNGTVVSYTYDSSGNITQISRDGARKITVSFDPNGGSCTTDSKTVITGEKYGELPTAARDEWYFDGWYTDVLDGSKITADDTVEIMENHTLYAHWSKHNYVVVEQLPGKTVYDCTHCDDSYEVIEPAYEWYYNGSSPYHVSTEAELNAFAELVNYSISFEGETVALSADITADSVVAVGTSEHSFSGTFDGNGYEISLSNATSGVFGCTGEAGTIMNLSVNAEITAENQTVGMIANINNGKVQNCAASGLITAETGTVGGICGQNSGTVYNCLYAGDIRYNGNLASECIDEETGEYTREVLDEAWGTICGVNSGSMTYCYYGIEDDIDNPKHSGKNSTGEYRNVHMYMKNYCIFGYAAGFKYVGNELDGQAENNGGFMRWSGEQGTLPTLQKDN